MCTLRLKIWFMNINNAGRSTEVPCPLSATRTIQKHTENLFFTLAALLVFQHTHINASYWPTTKQLGIQLEWGWWRLIGHLSDFSPRSSIATSYSLKLFSHSKLLCMLNFPECHTVYAFKWSRACKGAPHCTECSSCSWFTPRCRRWYFCFCECLYSFHFVVLVVSVSVWLSSVSRWMTLCWALLH